MTRIQSSSPVPQPRPLTPISAPRSSLRPMARPEAPAQPAQQDQSRVQARPSANIDPASFQMPREIEEIYQAIRNYPNSKATDAEAREMAREIFQAAREFGVDYRTLTAIMAHESKFDPRARSSTGAGGLGQLTNSAIGEVKRVAGLGRQPFAAHQEIFNRIDQRRSNRNNIRDNVWTSAAYVRLMQDRARGNNVRMLQNYNGEAARRQSYPRQVQQAYQELWQQPMPQRRAAS